MKKLLIFIILSLPFILSTCKEKEELIRKVDPELKEWGLYQKGTWWVYEEENSKIIDSVWVDTALLLYSKDNKYENEKFEYYVFIFRSLNSKDTFNFSITSYSNDVQIMNQTTFNQETGGSCVLLQLPLIKGEHYGSCSAFKWAELDTIYDTLTIHSRTFKNVVRVYDMCNPAFNQQPTFFYTVRNIGIVRKEFPDVNQIWNLVRFNIIQ